VAPVHDFVRKLRQPGLLPRVVDYVAWRRSVLAARARGEEEPALPAWAPLSVNLDLTTACNYACDHCIDWDALNTGVGYDDRRLRASLDELAARGLRSVILIGGGEPTVYPGFAGIVRRIKDLGLQVAVVSNGSRNERILEVIDRLDGNDWVRLSLDAGTDATFQAMHRPKRPVTLERICAGVPPWRERNPAPRIGFSFVVTWAGARRDATPVVENLHEIPAAARLAREHGFDYVSFKPFLARGAGGAEVMDPSRAEEDLARVVARIRAAVDEARALETPSFRVLESTNLRLLESGDAAAWTRQPRTCHMQALRQVLSPLGLFNCPAHRGVEKARIRGRDAYEDAGACGRTAEATAGILDRFDASRECAEVTCLYNAANWWLDAAVADDRGLEGVEALPGEDLFL
jgi:MoaA/NifB/PqqE/SkfB family radical SAM enzyme